jgi:hypothetical protein
LQILAVLNPHLNTEVNSHSQFSFVSHSWPSNFYPYSSMKHDCIGYVLKKCSLQLRECKKQDRCILPRTSVIHLKFFSHSILSCEKVDALWNSLADIGSGGIRWVDDRGWPGWPKQWWLCASILRVQMEVFIARLFVPFCVINSLDVCWERSVLSDFPKLWNVHIRI